MPTFSAIHSLCGLQTPELGAVIVGGDIDIRPEDPYLIPQ